MAFPERKSSPRTVQLAPGNGALPHTVGDQATDLAAEVARLTAENASLRDRQASANRLTLKVGDKGGVMVIGLGRFPTTLYAEQWERLLAISDDIRGFIRANSGKLSYKR